MAVPIIEQAKIQAQVLVPLIKALRSELGQERADALVRTAIGDIYRRFGEEWRKANGSSDVGNSMAAAFASYAEGHALEYTVHRQSKDAYEFDVTQCRFAEFYKKLGEPELGFLLVCSQDFPFADGFEPDVELTRSQTIMQDASHCDFRYKRQSD